MRTSEEDGFSLVEVVIAMFVLGIIAIMLLPALLSGIRYSGEQSTVATATRRLNAIVEEARQSPTCLALQQIAETNTSSTDGAGRPFEIDVVRGTCSTAANSLVTLTLSATQGSLVLAELEALIFVKKS